MENVKGVRAVITDLSSRLPVCLLRCLRKKRTSAKTCQPETKDGRWRSSGSRSPEQQQHRSLPAPHGAHLSLRQLCPRPELSHAKGGGFGRGRFLLHPDLPLRQQSTTSEEKHRRPPAVLRAASSAAFPREMESLAGRGGQWLSAVRGRPLRKMDPDCTRRNAAPLSENTRATLPKPSEHRAARPRAQRGGCGENPQGPGRKAAFRCPWGGWAELETTGKEKRIPTGAVSQRLM